MTRTSERSARKKKRKGRHSANLSSGGGHQKRRGEKSLTASRRSRTGDQPMMRSRSSARQSVLVASSGLSAQQLLNGDQHDPALRAQEASSAREAFAMPMPPPAGDVLRVIGDEGDDDFAQFDAFISELNAGDGSGGGRMPQPEPEPVGGGGGGGMQQPEPVFAEDAYSEPAPPVPRMSMAPPPPTGNDDDSDEPLDATGAAAPLPTQQEQQQQQQQQRQQHQQQQQQQRPPQSRQGSAGGEPVLRDVPMGSRLPPPTDSPLATAMLEELDESFKAKAYWRPQWSAADAERLLAPTPLAKRAIARPSSKPRAFAVSFNPGNGKVTHVLVQVEGNRYSFVDRKKRKQSVATMDDVIEFMGMQQLTEEAVATMAAQMQAKATAAQRAGALEMQQREAAAAQRAGALEMQQREAALRAKLQADEERERMQREQQQQQQQQMRAMQMQAAAMPPPGADPMQVLLKKIEQQQMAEIMGASSPQGAAAPAVTAAPPPTAAGPRMPQFQAAAGRGGVGEMYANAPSRKCMLWDAAAVAAWTSRLAMQSAPELANTFQESGIDGECLFSLEASDLASLGLRDPAQQQYFLRLVSELP